MVITQHEKEEVAESPNKLQTNTTSPPSKIYQLKYNPGLENGLGYAKIVKTEWNMAQFLSTFKYSFICQGTSTRRQRSDLFGLRVKLPLVTTSLTTQR